MQHGPDPSEPWCLIMAIWGDKYHDSHVNELKRQVRALSPSLSEVVLFTDRLREGVDADVRQTIFPEYFNSAEFFGFGYRAKLAVFSREALPRGRGCLFVDLDTVITGDLGRIVALIKGTEDCLMMPPAGLGFGALRRLVDKLRGGRTYPIGNSSLVAFHSDAHQNFSEGFQRLHEAGLDVTARHMIVDDVFISWFARGRMRGIPKSLAVLFRREFMARSRIILWARSAFPSRRRRRAGVVAVTLNGLVAKPEHLVTLAEGSVIRDKHGRIGVWSDAQMGPIRQKIIASCRRMIAADPAA